MLQKITDKIRYNILFSAVVAAVFLTGDLAAATPNPAVAVFPIQGTNLDAGEQAAIGEIFATTYATVSAEVVAGPGTSAAPRTQSESAAEAAAKMGVNEFIEISAVRLSTRIKLRASRFAADGTPIFTSTMTARSLDDLEPVAERLAQALYKKTSAAKTATLDTVTQGESSARNRVFTEKVMGVKLSISQPVARKARFNRSMAAMFDGRLEGDDYFLEFGGGLLIDVDENTGATTNMSALIGEIGGSYYLNHDNISAYVGGGAAPRINFSHGPRLAFYGQAGLMFFRRASSRLYTDIRVSQHVLGVKGDDVYTYGGAPNYTESLVREAKTMYPTEFTLSVGIGW